MVATFASKTISHITKGQIVLTEKDHKALSRLIMDDKIKHYVNIPAEQWHSLSCLENGTIWQEGEGWEVGALEGGYLRWLL